MDVIQVENRIFCRIDPGEELVESIRSIAATLGMQSVAIVSGVGMLTNVVLGFFDAKENRYSHTNHEGVFDLSSVQGSVTSMDDSYYPHVHVVVNDPKSLTLSGHLIRAECHITVELWLLDFSSLPLMRVAVEGRPSSLITIDR